MTQCDGSPALPAGLKASGRALWQSVMSEYELEEHEAGLLLQLARTADLLDDLAAEVGRRGVMTADGRVSPAAVEHRQQSIAFARLSAALRLPAGDEEQDRRPQRRMGVRGTYGIRGAVS